MIPNLLSLLSSFVRDHGENAREMLRCGGIDIIEQLLAANKALNTNSDEILGQETLMSVLTVYPGLARLLVAALLDVRSACSHYTGLETIVFSRLLFNLQLWFAGPSQAHGVALYASLFPVLSSLAHTTPRKVRDCVGVRPMVELLREYLNVGDKQVCTNSDASAFFHFFSQSHISCEAEKPRGFVCSLRSRPMFRFRKARSAHSFRETPYR
jgi:hypothetical protein